MCMCVYACTSRWFFYAANHSLFKKKLTCLWKYFFYTTVSDKKTSVVKKKNNFFTIFYRYSFVRTTTYVFEFYTPKQNIIRSILVCLNQILDE